MRTAHIKICKFSDLINETKVHAIWEYIDFIIDQYIEGTIPYQEISESPYYQIIKESYKTSSRSTIARNLMDLKKDRILQDLERRNFEYYENGEYYDKLCFELPIEKNNSKL